MHIDIQSIVFLNEENCVHAYKQPYYNGQNKTSCMAYNPTQTVNRLKSYKQN